MLQLFSSLALGDATITSVTEYLLTQPILSFTVLGYSPVRAVADLDGSSGEDSDEESYRDPTTNTVPGFDSRRNAVLLKLHCVHTRYV